MSTVSHPGKSPKSLVRANPILNRLNRVEERSATDAATFSGIASKVSFFLLMTLAGIILQTIVKNALANEPIWQSFKIYEKFTLDLRRTEGLILIGVTIAGFISELVAIFAQRTAAVSGSIYSVCQGYFISFLVFNVLKGYEYLGLEALLLTVAVVGVMSWLYSSGRLQDSPKFRVIMLTLVLASIGIGLLSFILTLIPATRPFAQSIFGNPMISIGFDVLGILIASLFLISDFSLIQTCVRDGYPKQYEWYAAFGLVFTVLWLYLKILDVIMQVAGKNKD